MTTTFPAYAVDSISVMADGSLSLAVTKIARSYSRDNATVVNVSYLPPKIQQEQILEGGAADIVITPLSAWIDTMKLQGLVDISSQAAVAKNRLALVGPKGSALEAKWPKFPSAQIIRALGEEQGFVIGNPESRQDGIYAKQALRSMKALGEMEPYTLYIKSQEEMFDMISTYGAYGVFFYSDALTRGEVQVIDLIPEHTHKPIEYYAVVVAGENMPQARKFLEYLRSDPAQKLFRESGV